MTNQCQPEVVLLCARESGNTTLMNMVEKVVDVPPPLWAECLPAVAFGSSLIAGGVVKFQPFPNWMVILPRLASFFHRAHRCLN
ncbi:hypothetical protein O9929_01995 [Vibrio lentus]|nr:hypothetical protein [Vibrio lentus]